MQVPVGKRNIPSRVFWNRRISVHTARKSTLVRASMAYATGAAAWIPGSSGIGFPTRRDTLECRNSGLELEVPGGWSLAYIGTDSSTA
jgi:hypothetical protein